MKQGTGRGASRVVASLVIVALSTVLMTSTAFAAPVIGGTGTFTYGAGAGAMAVGTGITVTGGTSYAGQHIDFAVTAATASETLSMATDASPVTTLGVVSIVGTTVYIGTGSATQVIGSIDPTLNGVAGQPLRVNFTSAFVNPGFEDGLNGWTVLNQRIDLGVDTIAGCPTVDTSTYPVQDTSEDNNVPFVAGTMATTAETTGLPTEGLQDAHLQSTGITTLAGFDVVHGPAVVSSPFDATAGDVIDFDWRAFAGVDNYHVFGYLIDGSCNQLEVLDSTGSNSAWTTKETTIPTSGTYRFVFVSGTFDATGGFAAGASLLLDNVKVFGSIASDDVAQQIARKLQYSNSLVDAVATRTITVTAQAADLTTGTASITVNLVPDRGFLGLVPSRLLDTRTAGVKVAAGSTSELVVAGQGGVPADATAVVLNVTVESPAAAGYVTVFPCGGSLPLASNLNYVAGQTVANSVTVAVGTGGKVCFYSLVATHLIVDVNGAYSPSGGTGLLVDGVVPSRLLDTRTAGVKVAAGATRELVVAGSGGVPADATAVVLNVTVESPAAAGYLTVFPCGSPFPLASNLNYVAGQTVANSATVAVGTGGKVCFYALASTHLIVDVNGAYSPTAGTGHLVGGIVPSRLLDTRTAGVKVAAGATRELVVAGSGGVPSNAMAVVLNVTVESPAAAGYLTVFPCGSPFPLASNLNYVAGQTVANSAMVAVGTAGKVCFYALASTDLIVDANAAFTPASPAPV